MDEASGKPYWHDGKTTTWDDPTSKKRPAPDAEQPPVKMRKQSGYVFFQSQHREAASAAVDIDPDTNTLGARERNQAVMRKLAEMWGALDDAAKQKWSDDAPRVPVKERKPKAKVVKEAKPAAKAKEAVSGIVDALSPAKTARAPEEEVSFNVEQAPLAAGEEPLPIELLDKPYLKTNGNLKVGQLRKYLARKMRLRSEELELLCDGEELSGEHALRFVKGTVWTKPSELVIQFRRAAGDA